MFLLLYSSFLGFFILPLLLLPPQAQTLITSSSYIGAVAQHAVYYGSSGSSSSSENNNSSESLSELVDTNLYIYERMVRAAAENGAQIIIFPEFGLVPVKDDDRVAIGTIAEIIPDPDLDPDPDADHSSTTPCGNIAFTDRIILTRSSCVAQMYKILVMVNMVDWIDCDTSSDPSCPSDDHYQITTDVLFDESGRIVAKYHKSHEWPGLIPLYDQPATPSRVTYTSSFGVEFGLFICFDIMFPDPPVALVDKGIKHFLYAVKQGLLGEETLISSFSRRHNVTLLSANLASDLLVHDCSGVIVSGETLPHKKIFIGEDFPEENVLLSVIQY